MEKDTPAHRKIGLFGGTFNPVHIGHLRCAEEIREQFSLHRVVFIPAALPPHKKAPGVSAQHRCEMVQRAISSNPYFAVSDIELQREGSSYSHETIVHFCEQCADNTELYFIMGSDAFREVHTWRNYPAFFDRCSFIVMNRPGHDMLSPLDLPAGCGSAFRRVDAVTYAHRSGNRVCVGRVSMLDVSSTEIRSRLQRAQSVTCLVTEAVGQYIQENGLYAKAR